MPSQPTKRQLTMLRFVARYVYEHGRQPSYQEVCEHFGWRSRNAVTSHLTRLEKSGVIQMHHGRRAIVFKGDWKNYL